MNNIEFLEKKAMQLREDILRMTTKAGIGHVTSSFSCIELMTALYYGGLMKFDSSNATWEKRDYFIFSKGHANPILYCILADLGFFPREKLNLFCQPGGELGVLLRSDVPGAEITSGSLGCGLGIAAGIAQAIKMDKKTNTVYCMIGDAECHEGSIWEALLHIGFNRLNNLITIIDRNYLGATHFIEDEAGIEPLFDKMVSFGFEVKQINGHKFEEIFEAIGDPKCIRRSKPLIIIADTIKGKGVSFIENKPLKHGEAVSKAELERAIEEVRGGLCI